MREVFTSKCLLFCFVCCCLLFMATSVQGQQKQAYQSGVVRVKFSPQTAAKLAGTQLRRSSDGVALTGIQAIDALNTKFKAKSFKRVFPDAGKHEAKHRKHGLHLWYEVSYETGASALQVASSYKQSAEATNAEPIYAKKLYTAPAEEPPYNDPYLKSQWHYNNTGQTAVSAPGADINLFKAWEVQTGKSNVVVAIVDGGIDTKHEDLKPNLWINQVERNGKAGVDDDRNGYVDDIHGYNFVTRTGNVSAHDHGTHVAGTVGAVNNNGIGVSGVAGGSGKGDGVRLMSTQVFTNDGSGGFGQAIVYAADNGAVIAQNSWGYQMPDVYEQSVLDAIDYFIEEAGNYEGSPMRGGIVIFAAGNDGVDGKWWPGYYEKTLAVSSLGPDNKRAYYSNFGSWVDIAAPGGDVTNGQDHGVLSTMPNNKYGYMQGTSMACPHVSGIAALVVSQLGGSGFTPTQLRTQLVTAVHNMDDINPNYTGKLGAGLVDARLALNKNEGIAPAAISSLQVAGISQDFATLAWSVPADEDDGKPVAFQVLYAKEAITETNAGKAKMLVFESGKAVGEEVTFEVNGLEPLTMYYFAVRGVDRWGNTGALSNLALKQTNQGPSIALTPEALDVTINAATGKISSQTFGIQNNADGILRWDSLVRNKSHSLSYDNTKLNYPASNGIATTTKSKLQIGKVSETAINDLTITPKAFFYQEKSHAPFQGYIVGDEDLALTNSAAVRFYVDEAAGFNLTQLSFYAKHNQETGPIIVEVYEGATLSTASLVLAIEENSYETSDYWRYITLDEQLYFEKGKTFWVVYHVPSNNLYPLGMGAESMATGSDNCFFSSDLGKTWIPMETAIADPNYAWNISAVSTNQHLGTYITLSPASGTLEGNTSTDVALQVDASKLINGSYSANVIIRSNDNANPEVRLPVNVTVEGHLPVLASSKIVEFGNVFFGRQKEVTVAVKNTGYGNFNVSDVTSTNPQFVVKSKPFQIAALEEANLTIVYTPDGAGNDNGTIKLSSTKGREYSFNIFGVGTEPAQIVITPAEQSFSDLAIGDETQGKVTISNTGQYPLEYVIPKFAPDAQIEGATNSHRYGYSWKSNMAGYGNLTWNWEDISATGTDITAFFKDNENKYYEVDLGFDFPFYGTQADKLYLTAYGVLTLDTEGPMGNCMPPALGKDLCTPKGYISAFFAKFDLLQKGRVLYKKESGRVIFQYQDVEIANSFTQGQKATFQIVVEQNGDIEFRYLDIESIDSFMLASLFAAVEDPAHADGLLASDITNPIINKNNTVMRFAGPGADIITSISEPQGVLQVGESKEINFTLSTAGLSEGDLYQVITVVSNDPINVPATFKVNTSITKGGVAAVSLSKEVVDFGKVFQTGSEKDVLMLRNTGSKAMQITNVALANNAVKLEGETTFELKAKSTAYYTLTLPTENLGAITDVFTATTATGETYTAMIQGEVIPAPQLTVDTTPITETLHAGEKISKKITVTNTGASDLEMVSAGNDWLYVGEPVVPGTLKEFAYYTKDSNTEGGPAFKWEELIGKGTQIPADYFNNTSYWYALPLPYEVNFYNEPQDTLYIGPGGMMTFSKPTIDGTSFMPSKMPDPSEPNSLIAPYWSRHSTDYYTPAAEKGVFYKIYDDRIVIEYAQYIDMFSMGNPYHFEAIIYKNGTIKFQYKVPGFSRTALGVIGIENKTGTEGVEMAYHQNYIKDQLAIVFTPAEKVVVPAGESKTFTLNIDATQLNAGAYTGKLTFYNNTPTTPEVTLPVNLTVIGAPVLETVASLNYGELMAYAEESVQKAYIKEFEISNSGTDKLELAGISLAKGEEVTLEMYVSSFFGASWQPIETVPMPLILKAADHAKLRVTVQPSGTIASLVDEVIFKGNMAKGEHRVPVTATIILPPVLVVETEAIAVKANTADHQETRTIVVDNSAGKSTLKYNLSLNFDRVANAEPETASLVEKRLAVAHSGKLSTEKVAGIAPAAVTADDAFHHVLAYDTQETATDAIGFGAGIPFTSATAFVAPADGFNLTHVKTWYRAGDWLNSEITVEVRAGGSDISTARTLAVEEFSHNISAPDESGGFLTFELKENQLIMPNEQFYVIINYPLGAANPQGVATFEVPITGNFLYPSEGKWFDLTADFPTYGWMVKALEKEHENGAWVNVDGSMEGEIPAGEKANISLNFSAAKAGSGTQTASLNIASNDPYHPAAAVALSLHMNQAPKFVEAPADVLTVAENETLTIQIKAEDVEEDAFTYQLSEAYAFTKLEVADDIATIVYTPDYKQAGEHTFTLIATDAYGFTSNVNYSVNVTDVNRAPIATDMNDRNYSPADPSDILMATDIFRDEDGDGMKFQITSENTEVVKVYISQTEFMLVPKAEGVTKVTLTATDSRGASTSVEFIANVTQPLGVKDELEAGWKVYPNPTTDVLRIELDATVVPAGSVTIRVYNATGGIAYFKELPNGQINATHTVDVSTLPSGVYFVELVIGEKKLVRRIVKL
jgi:subtilisin family serine protease